VAQLFGAFLVLFAGLGISAAEAGFRSPESRVRNVYAYYGDRSSDLSGGLPRDLPRRGGSSIRACIVVNGPDGWVISDVERRMIRYACFSPNIEIEHRN
jgi:hypothetical protein